MSINTSALKREENIIHLTYEDIIMLKKEITYRNPLMNLGYDNEDILPDGGFGAVMAYAGVGKTAALAGMTECPEAYYRAADLFVFPSTGEGLPNALIEAHASGLASVATAISGVTEDVVDDGNTGVIVPQDDGDRFSAAAVSLLQDDARRREMGVAARARAEKLFSLDHVARQYVELYGKLL